MLKKQATLQGPFRNDTTKPREAFPPTPQVYRAVNSGELESPMPAQCSVSLGATFKGTITKDMRRNSSLM